MGNVVAIVLVVLSVILSVALMTLTERKVMAALQRRMGPTDDFGLFQPFVDGIKLVQKESVVPLESSNWLFLATPFTSFYLALLNWLVLPLDEGLVLSELVGGGILILIANSELSIYGVILSGWSANSKYPFIGSLRSTAQMISYSCSISLLLLSRALVAGNIDLMLFIEPLMTNYPAAAAATIPYYLTSTAVLRFTSVTLALLPVTLLFAICIIAETNRAPFDLPEAESELVAGFFTEHSAVTFAYFFLGEFTNILAMATLFFVLFLGLSLALPFVLFIYVLALPILTTFCLTPFMSLELFVAGNY